MLAFSEGISAGLSKEACGLLAPEDHYQHKSKHKFKETNYQFLGSTPIRRHIHIASHEHYKSIHPPHISQEPFKLALFVCWGGGCSFVWGFFVFYSFK